ncbi:spore coat protein [Sporomusa acidovorans]|uniref:Spore coat protein F n=1 Tax=Sporomusa acidovorans (strain ATCC 49682 / DSM 3132 / Mol) TaxID=1123286 RepID=A0ABZ3JBT5_SPOA4|nr:spore coat protein [Sporomusa acidovorans]OZC13226.1 spore coat protein F precursor [Sporomusa acidovorans DSM 3132]SDE00605.1 similar to spore coat protein [Sporomusa acidovorans]
MGLLDELFGDNNVTNATLGDKDIASDMLKDSKFAVTSLAMMVTEISNPEVRTTLAKQLTSSVQMHQRLSDMLIHKEWYKPYASPQQQLSQDVHMTQNAIR